MKIIKPLLFVLLCIPLLSTHAEESDRSDDREQLKQILNNIVESLNKWQTDT